MFYLRTLSASLFTVLFALVCGFASAQPGNQCSTALQLTGNPSSHADSLPNATEHWYSFTAVYPDMNVQVVNLNPAAGSDIQIEVFDGSCSSLTPIGTLVRDTVPPADTLTSVLTDLLPGFQYYVRISRFDPQGCRTCDPNYNLQYNLNISQVVQMAAPCACSVLFPYDSTNTCEAVCNGGFELFNTISGTMTVQNGINFRPACPWRDPNSPAPPQNINTTPDLYNTNGSPGWSVPNNLAGNEPSATPAVNGQLGYAGIFGYWDTPLFAGSQPREYISAPLNYTLIQGKQYKITFKVALAENSGYAVSNIGALLSTNMPSQVNGQPLNVPSAQLAAVSNGIVNNYSWVTISNVVTATGSENWITLGQFTNNAAANITTVNSSNPNSSVAHGAYYYIDSVSIVPYPDDITVSANPQTVCSGDPVTLIANSNVVNAYNYNWVTTPLSNSTGLINNYNDTVVAIPVFPNFYYCIIHLPGYNGCTISDSVYVNVRPGPTLADAGSDITLCVPDTINLTGFHQGSTNVFYWTDGNNNVVCSQCSTTTVVATPPTYYVYHAENTVTGCSRTDTMFVTVPPPPNAVINGVIYGCDSAAVYCPAQQNSNATFTWTAWDASYTTQIPITPLVFNCVRVDWLNDNGGGAGHIVLTVTTAAGCSASDTLDVVSCCRNPQTGNFLYNTSMSVITGNNNPVVLSNVNPYINGTLTIDVNTHFVTSDINMGPYAKIVVSGGHTLRLEEDSVMGSCCEMWDAIEGMSVNDSIIIYRNTYVGDGIRGVVSNNGAVYRIYGNTHFNKNYVSITVNPYNGTHGGTVESTWFESVPNTYCPASNDKLLPPYSGQYPQYGIRAERVNAISFGNPQATYAGANHFVGLLNGIRTIETNSLIRNNQFVNINRSKNSRAVWATGRFPTISPFNITQYSTQVGGPNPNVAQRNFFTDCNFGVWTDTAMSTIVLNCKFVQNVTTATNGIGVRVNNCTGLQRSIQIERDSMINCAVSIMVYRSDNPACLIRWNYINKTISSTTDNPTGIFLSGTGNNTGSFNVSINRIFEQRTGIESLSMNNVVIRDNLITVRPTTTPIRNVRGIWVVDNNSTKVQSNIVSSTSQVSSAWVGTIYIADSPNTQVTCNILRDAGYGIQFAGPNNTPGSVYNNRMTNTYTGLWLSNGAIIGQQGVQPNQPSDNRWQGNIVNRCYTSGTGSNITLGGQSPILYRPNGAIYNPNPSIPAPGNQPISTGTTTVQNPPQQLCVFVFLPTQGQQIRQQVAQGQVQFPGNQIRGSRISREGVYHQLLLDSTLLNGDPVLINFKDSADQNNLGVLYNGLEIIGTRSMNAPNVVQNAVLNLQMLVADSVDHLLRNVETMLLLQIADSVEFTPNDLDTLRSYAVLCPYQEGRGVYLARAILAAYDTTEYQNICEYDPQNPMRSGVQLPSEALESDAMELYPNPSDGNVTIEYALSENQTGRLEIYSATGAIVRSYNLQNSTESQQILLDDLEAGIYTYRYYVDYELKKADKIVIMK